MSYADDHPTHFDWTNRVRAVVRRVQRHHPWQTYINTYVDHPPGFGAWPYRFYDRVSLDVWGGGGTSAETYTGYRGKPLPKALGDEMFDELFYAKSGPLIDWIIWQGRMWWAPATGGPGWTSAPSGPPDSDPGHYSHIHCTYQRGT